MFWVVTVSTISRILHKPLSWPNIIFLNKKYLENVWMAHSKKHSTTCHPSYTGKQNQAWALPVIKCKHAKTWWDKYFYCATQGLLTSTIWLKRCFSLTRNYKYLNHRGIEYITSMIWLDQAFLNFHHERNMVLYYQTVWLSIC